MAAGAVGHVDDSSAGNGLSQISYVPGEVVALLSELQDLTPGFYMIQSFQDGWVALRLLFDDEARDRLVATDRVYHLPESLLEFFMGVGIRMMALH